MGGHTEDGGGVVHLKSLTLSFSTSNCIVAWKAGLPKTRIFSRYLTIPVICHVRSALSSSRNCVALRTVAVGIAAGVAVATVVGSILAVAGTAVSSGARPEVQPVPSIAIRMQPSRARGIHDLRIKCTTTAVVAGFPACLVVGNGRLESQLPPTHLTTLRPTMWRAGSFRATSRWRRWRGWRGWAWR